MSVPRVYSLGNTPILSYLTLCLANYSKQQKTVPNIILLLQDKKKVQRFLQNESHLELVDDMGNTVFKKQFMASCEPPKYANGEFAELNNLLISENSFLAYKHNLHKYKSSLLKANCDNSTNNILLLNPPLSVVQAYKDFFEENALVDKGRTPNLLIGRATPPHAISSRSEFVSSQSITVKLINLEIINVFHNELDTAQCELFKIINETSKEIPDKLMTSTKSYNDYLIDTLEKIVVQSCFGPMSLLLDANNKQLKATKYLYEPIWRKLCSESSQILTAAYPQFTSRFTSERLFDLCLFELAKLSSNKRNPMLKSLKTNSETNIDHVNGLLVRMAENLKMPCTMHKTIYRLAKANIKAHRLENRLKH
ncbi:uncharacterized protein SCODWIG_00058 [Saccharomycodes ludwigii]|uniref:Ketopantoate reductase C-terminal domain-containing protein n=1 Tax=Saccharomycodes ludwigii TaxID=36035 RepID=A0A376B0V0_9ASCO|nr:hypothetical protein SCDLUD_001876 [Saccharomycodes ludwigii]KAH3902065.1 hypothetical protein SCDLUD_001876 [Saccharomycodes ludwigii]SSD58297.1 uncharacterized protein SCODWIG_00058 [Saccharomycodes ludwigii]